MGYITSSRKVRGESEESTLTYDRQVLTEDNINTEKRIIHFYGDVDDKSAAQLCRNLLAMDDGKLPIEVHLTTDGGTISDAHAIVATMRMCKSEVIVLGVGNVYSAGTIMIQGASPGCRYATKDTLFLLHQPRPNFAAHGRPLDVFNNQLNVCIREMELINKPVHDNMGMTYKQYMDFIFSEKILTAQEAKDLGVIAKVIMQMSHV